MGGDRVSSKHRRILSNKRLSPVPSNQPSEPATQDVRCAEVMRAFALSAYKWQT